MADTEAKDLGELLCQTSSAREFAHQCVYNQLNYVLVCECRSYAPFSRWMSVDLPTPLGPTMQTGRKGRAGCN